MCLLAFVNFAYSSKNSINIIYGSRFFPLLWFASSCAITLASDLPVRSNSQSKPVLSRPTSEISGRSTSHHAKRTVECDNVKEVVLKDGNVNRIGTYVVFSCDQGFHLHGKSVGKWSLNLL
jgi:hypothetical protein